MSPTFKRVIQHFEHGNVTETCGEQFLSLLKVMHMCV